MKEKNYLTDEELEKLILEVEAEKLIDTPPDLVSNILASIEKFEQEEVQEPFLMNEKETVTEISKPPSAVDFNQKKSEYRRYCFRVISSMAAAIAFLVILPGISGMKESDIPSKESIVAENVQTREEVTGNNGKRIISTINESHVFSNIWNFNFFE